MSAYRVGAEEFAANAAEYVRRAEQAGESFTITRDGEPVAVLAPVHRGKRLETVQVLFAALPRAREEEVAAFAAGPPSARERDADLCEPWAR